MPDMRLKLTLAYDGSGFRGWAAQPGLRTVEATLRAALDTIFPSSGEPCGRGPHGHRRACAGQRGEHRRGRRPGRGARGRGVELRSAARRRGHLGRGGGARLSRAVLRASAQTYRYRIWRSRIRSPFEAHRSWWYPRPLDVGRLSAQAAFLLGRHDFRAFTRTETQHGSSCGRSRMRAGSGEGDVLVFEITADSFLRHMVRTLVGTMVDGVDLAPLLDGRPRERPARRHRPPACTSPALPTIERHAISGRSVRPRRHARRFRCARSSARSTMRPRRCFDGAFPTSGSWRRWAARTWPTRWRSSTPITSTSS